MTEASLENLLSLFHAGHPLRRDYLEKLVRMLIADLALKIANKDVALRQLQGQIDNMRSIETELVAENKRMRDGRDELVKQSHQTMNGFERTITQLRDQIHVLEIATRVPKEQG